jgi:hypothetical protein
MVHLEVRLRKAMESTSFDDRVKDLSIHLRLGSAFSHLRWGSRLLPE